MRTKWIKKLMIILVMLLFLAGCQKEPEPAYSRLKGLEYEDADLSVLSGEDLEIRSTFEFLEIYSDYLETQSVDIEENVEKYGIEDFSRMNDLFRFHSFNDMVTVFNNAEFQTDLNSMYSTDVKHQYYIPPIDLPNNAMGLLVHNQNVYFYIFGTDISDGEFKQWGVYDVQNKKSLKEILNYYVAMDDLTIQSENYKDLVIYHIPFSESTLFCAIRFPMIEITYTAYFWEQDNVIGVLVLPGEYNEENLGLCVLEKHDI